ncbi:hypothetical protein B0J17DRAFT_720045 [Rhizoctonia solani]|nr:hypothetical protein B0J17DRAFT_720045 [Rhizoctonia solani]
MPVFPSVANLFYSYCMDVDFYVQNGPEGMRSDLNSSANFIHSLLRPKTSAIIHCIRRNLYKDPKWGLLHWLDPEGEEGPAEPYEVPVYHWWHFIAFGDSPNGINLILIYPPDNSAPPAYSQEGAAGTSTSAAQVQPANTWEEIWGVWEKVAQDKGWKKCDYSGWSQEEVQYQQDVWGEDSIFSEEELLAMDKLD